MTSDPVLDAKNAEYQARRAEHIEGILDDVIANDAHVGHLTVVMTAQCSNCHACHEGRFTRNMRESRYETIEFASNTRDAEWETDDYAPGDDDVTTGYDCSTCGYPVSDEVRDSILWLTRDELYVVIKASTMKTIEDARDLAVERSKSHRRFLPSSLVWKPEDVEPGMSCRTWSVREVNYVTGIVLSAYQEEGRWFAKVVTDRSEVLVKNMGDVVIGAIIEEVGDYTLMQRVQGDWVIFRSEGYDPKAPLEDAQAYGSREAAIRSVASSL